MSKPLDPSLALDRRDGLPDALRVLEEAFPKAQWAQHPNFGELVRFWMDRHNMFRQITAALHDDAQAVMAQQMDPRSHGARLVRYGGLLVNELHNHHQIEDHHYFPQLVGLVPEIDRAFDLLETDHESIDPMLHDLTAEMNAVLQGGGPVGRFDEALLAFDRLLDRHLTDEEEIIVPVILKSGFTG
ncbi:MAG: dihydrodipicolinate reductase [Rhodobacteraceae bacterium]|nr:dihydrodipicolinate reductase [Paracoccaceae bacterium]